MLIADCFSTNMRKEDRVTITGERRGDDDKFCKRFPTEFSVDIKLSELQRPYIIFKQARIKGF
jgi:hypothetical protein